MDLFYLKPLRLIKVIDINNLNYHNPKAVLHTHYLYHVAIPTDVSLYFHSSTRRSRATGNTYDNILPIVALTYLGTPGFYVH